MKTLILFDSKFGNTEKVAREIAKACGIDTTTIKNTTEIAPEQLKGFSLIIAGAPTHAFRPSEPMKQFISSIPAHSLEGVKCATFDTRIAIEDVHSKFLGVMVRFFGYAASPLAKALTAKGAQVVHEPAGFYVDDQEGPLKPGELERAAKWAQEIKKLCGKIDLEI